MHAADLGDALPAAGVAVRFAVADVRPRADRLLRVQGYAEPARVRPRIREAAEEAARVAAEIARGEVALRRLDIAALDGGRLSLQEGHAFHCDAFERFLGGCDGVIVFVLTAGEAFDREVARLMSSDEPVLALFLDAAGWMAVESVTRRFADALKRGALREGRRVTRRMGPGYRYPAGSSRGHAGAGAGAEWRLEEQAALFRALGAGPALPVELLDSSAMRPKMSRSGLFGLRPGGVAGAGPARSIG